MGKTYIVQVKSIVGDSWNQSHNTGASGEFRSLERAKKVAKRQETKSALGLEYRVREVRGENNG